MLVDIFCICISPVASEMSNCVFMELIATQIFAFVGIGRWICHVICELSLVDVMSAFVAAVGLMASCLMWRHDYAESSLFQHRLWRDELRRLTPMTWDVYYCDAHMGTMCDVWWMLGVHDVDTAMMMERPYTLLESLWCWQSWKPPSIKKRICFVHKTSCKCCPYPVKRLIQTKIVKQMF